MTSPNYTETADGLPADPDEKAGDADGPGRPSSSALGAGALCGDDRDRTSDDRDDTSSANDETAEARDRRADARDKRAAARDDAASKTDPCAVSDRASAKRDRQAGATDRKHAEHDREAAATDRALSARERAAFLVDELTGAHRRDAGILELERDMSRAKRTGQPFVLAFADVDHLKVTNDSLGHAAGNELLRTVAESIRHHVRSYDLIVRYGGDEFLCGLIDLSVDEAAKRFELVNAAVRQTCGGSATFGLAELQGPETLDELIERADCALYAQRRQHSSRN